MLPLFGLEQKEQQWNNHIQRDDHTMSMKRDNLIVALFRLVFLGAII